jgi:hypothetical protein
LQQKMEDDAAAQQRGFPMLARLDVLVVALSVAGGSMLIENSHRVDTGAPDEGLVAAAPALCRDEATAERYDLNHQAAIEGGDAGETDEAARPCSAD